MVIMRSNPRNSPSCTATRTIENTIPTTVAMESTRRYLFALRRFARYDGGRTLRIDVESQKTERSVSRVSPLMDETERLVHQSARRSCLGLALDGVGARSRMDVVKRRTRAVVRRIRRHPGRKRDTGQVEIMESGLQVGNRRRRAI